MSADLDHPADVLGFARDRLARGQRCALGVVTETVGGGVRAPGALVAVAGDGAMAGYVSNGCVDADLAAQAVAALEEGAPRAVRYGEGSAFRDVVLPCGGAVEIWLAPLTDDAPITAAEAALTARRPVRLSFGEAGEVLAARDAPNAVFAAELSPRQRLRIVGRGAEPLALARAALAVRYEVALWSPDAATCDAASALGVGEVEGLSTPSALPQAADDTWTAVVTLFHDHDWEPGVLAQALRGPAPYVGALGSKKAQAARTEALAELGVPAEDALRIKAPIGLVPSLRDASSVAISILAEIVADAAARRR